MELGAGGFEGLFLGGGGGVFSRDGRGCGAVGFGELVVLSGLGVRGLGQGTRKFGD